MITILLEKIKALLTELKTNIENIKPSIDYSTNETEIGTWINNKKIYRKTIYATSTNEIDLSSLHIDEFIGFDYGGSIYKGSNNVYYPITFYQSSSARCTIFYEYGRSKLNFAAGTNPSTSFIYITIIYTKKEV